MPNNRIDDLLNMGAGSEARMLDLESDPNWAQKVHTNIVGGEWDKYRDVGEDVVGSIAEPAPIDWILDFMDSYEDLKGETEATGESMLERAKQLKTLSTEEAQAEYDDELSQYSSDISSFLRGEGFSLEGYSPEVNEIVNDLMIGMVDPGRKIKGLYGGLMSLFNKFFKGGKGAPQTSKLVIKQSTKTAPKDIAPKDIAPKDIAPKDIASKEIDKIRRLLEETPTPHPIRIPRKFNKKRYEDIDPTEKPPLKFKGGGHLYRKGYYGKSYK